MTVMCYCAIFGATRKSPSMAFGQATFLVLSTWVFGTIDPGGLTAAGK